MIRNYAPTLVRVDESDNFHMYFGCTLTGGGTFTYWRQWADMNMYDLEYVDDNTYRLMPMAKTTEVRASAG